MCSNFFVAAAVFTLLESLFRWYLKLEIRLAICAENGEGVYGNLRCYSFCLYSTKN